MGTIGAESKYKIRMNITFEKLTNPTVKIARSLETWSNDPALVHLIRPNKNQAELEEFFSVTVDSLKKQLEQYPIYLIYLEGELVGEMNYQINPGHLYIKKPGSAWIGIVIGDLSARGKGIGPQAMAYIEKQILDQDLARIELGVFEFNTPALSLYQKLGYQEIGRIDNFTYWQGRMWQDIRLEKYL